LLRIASQTAQLLGNAVGGALLVVLTPQGAILVNAGSYLLSACITRLGVRPHPAVGSSDGGALLRDSLHGIRRIFADRPLRRLLLFGWLIPMCSVAPEALAAPYVVGKGAPASVVGLWLAALPVGIIVGDLVAVWTIGADRLRRLVGIAAAGSMAP